MKISLVTKKGETLSDLADFQYFKISL